MEIFEFSRCLKNSETIFPCLSFFNKISGSTNIDSVQPFIHVPKFLDDLLAFEDEITVKTYLTNYGEKATFEFQFEEFSGQGQQFQSPVIKTSFGKGRAVESVTRNRLPVMKESCANEQFEFALITVTILSTSLPPFETQV